jgi:hypothetical protein
MFVSIAGAKNNADEDAAAAGILAPTSFVVLVDENAATK